MERNASGVITCTHGHTHFDDPRTLDSTFGPLQYGEISYPWMTSNENVEAGKHRFYKWATYDGFAGCVAPGPDPLGLKHFRFQAHSDANAGATTRFHSYYFEGDVCDPNDPSFSKIVRVGGHMDYGSLFLDSVGYVALPGDDGPTGIKQRFHGSPQDSRADWTWYGHHNFLFVGLRQEDWGPVDPNNLSRQLFYADPGQNHSYQDPGHVIAGFHPSGVPMSGFADRAGKPVASGCVVGPDCVPYDWGGLVAGGRHFQFRTGGNVPGTREYDVKDATGKSFIVWPN